MQLHIPKVSASVIRLTLHSHNPCLETFPQMSFQAMEIVPSNKLVSVLVTVLRYAVDKYGSNLNASSQIEADKFFKQLGFLERGLVKALVDFAEENRMTRVLQDLLLQMPNETLSSNRNAMLLKKYLEERILYDQILEAKRNQLLKQLEELLTKDSIDHIFFKTFNRFGGVGVDIDLLIRRDSHQKCIRTLLSNGFAPIDSLSKTYATGFILSGGNNPIIVDLHTDIAVLGMTYFSPETLLHNKSRIDFSFLSEEGKQELTNLSVLNEKISPVVTMAHSVIKEGKIRACDMIEVCCGLRRDRGSFEYWVSQEHLHIARDIFATILISFLPDFVRDLPPVILNEKRATCDNGGKGKEEKSFWSTIAMLYVKRSLFENRIILPIKIPTVATLLALFDTIRARKKLGLSISKAIFTFGLGRNPIRAGEKIFHLLN